MYKRWVIVLRIKVITEEEKKDKNIFKQIIEENWEDFKKKYPSYNKPYMKKL